MGAAEAVWPATKGEDCRDDDPPLHDLRFRALLGPAAWSGLPVAVRQRFGRRLAADMSVIYAGTVLESRRTWIGRILAELARFIGAPLPLHDDIDVPAVVTVTEDGAAGGQIWTRAYGRPRGFPQVIHSSKPFSGPTGLEEHLGRGFGIALRLSVNAGTLHFHSDHYFIAIGPLRLRLTRWLGPGTLSISHSDLGDGAFAFGLVLRHPLFGEMIRQTCRFRERVAYESHQAM